MSENAADDYKPVIAWRTPWWTRVAAAVVAVLLGLALLLLVVGVLSSRNDARGEVTVARAQAEQSAAQVRCLTQRLDDLNAAGDITDEMSALVVMLASRDTEAYGPVMANLKTLSEQRAAADAARAAVEACKT